MTLDTLARQRYAAFTEFARELCELFPFSVTSWWRSAKHNATLPGHVGDSEHQVGTALDGVFDPGAEPDLGFLTAWCRERGVDVQRISGTSGGTAPAIGGEAPAPGEGPHYHFQLRTSLG